MSTSTLVTKFSMPSWLQPPKLDRGGPYAEGVLERALAGLEGGLTLPMICEDLEMPHWRELLSYFMSNPTLWEEYEKRTARRTEAMMEELRLVAEGGGGDVPEEVSRCKLVVDTMKWQIEKQAPKKYGPRTHTEVSYTYDISEALQRAQERMERLRSQRLRDDRQSVIDGEVILDAPE